MSERHSFARRASLVALSVAAACFSAPSARAERSLHIRSLPETALPFVSTVIAPLSRWAAVSDAAGAVAVAHQPESAVHVSIFRLDAAGQPVAGEPKTIVLPKPASLGARKTQVLGIAWHARFPLLYVWQDVDPTPEGATLDPPLVAELDHLLVYSLEEAEPKLLMAAARGANYAGGNIAGGVAIDASSRRLYVPNLRLPTMGKDLLAVVGWIMLGPDGLPALAEKAEPYAAPDAPATFGTVTAPKEPAAAAPLDAAAAAAARTAKLAAWAAIPAGNPLRNVRLNVDSAPAVVGGPSSPHSYAPINDKTVLLALYAGIGSWVLDDRLGRFGYMYVMPQIYNRFRVGAHPSFPQVYMTIVTYDGQLQRFELADGYITLVPQSLYIDGIVIYTPPLVIAKRKQLAFGASDRVCLVDLDDEGRFTTKGVQMTVKNPKVSGIAWSDRFERLYVAVEKTP